MTHSIGPQGDSGIEHSVWVKNWGTLPDPNNLPPGVNTINIFEGKIDCVNGQWTVDGLVWSQQLLTQYIAACHAKGIHVKISLGGAGGQGIYNNTWDQLTSGNVQSVAQGLAQFCQDNHIDGIDFDYEEQKSDEQRQLVGQLIKNFKQANPDLLTSVCTDAGNDGKGDYPWPADLAQIMDAAKLPDGSSAVDRIYVMSYDYPGWNEKDCETFMLNWKAFAANYGIPPSNISIGVDKSVPNLMPIDQQEAYIHFAYNQGFSTALWDQMDYNEGQYTQWVIDNYNSGGGLTPPTNWSQLMQNWGSIQKQYPQTFQKDVNNFLNSLDQTKTSFYAGAYFAYFMEANLCTLSKTMLAGVSPALLQQFNIAMGAISGSAAFKGPAVKDIASALQAVDPYLTASRASHLQPIIDQLEGGTSIADLLKAWTTPPLNGLGAHTWIVPFLQQFS